MKWELDFFIKIEILKINYIEILYLILDFLGKEFEKNINGDI